MFTFTNPELIEALVKAHQRHINVEIVLDHDSSRKTSQIALKRFQQEKMPVFVSKRQGLLHEKVAIIDESLLVIGSANWTSAAFRLNDENLSLLSPLSAEQLETLATFWKTTRVESVQALH
jgi:phosphatidylserine/phosphatidylglycerophosphate/cardiolipin synthase-like enzyme